MHINTVTVIGATGTMGANVAGIFASFGNAKVYCIGRDYGRVKLSIERAVSSVKSDAIRPNLVAATFEDLETCVASSDFVFESVAEDLLIKEQVARRIASSLKKGAISATGTSGFSINKMASWYPEELRPQFYGVHMFNPPYSLSLCELIQNDTCVEEQTYRLKEYLERVLHRTVVQVKDKPAFLGNRIGFLFMNEALQYAEKYQDNGGIDYIDSILGPVTGRAMAPIMTVDFVGLDVHKAIVDNLYYNNKDYANRSFCLPTYVQKLISEGQLGRKSSAGLYQIKKGGRSHDSILVYDIAKGVYRETIMYEFPFAIDMKSHIAKGEYLEAYKCLVNNSSLEANICLGFLVRYIVYSVYAAMDVASSIDAADDVMATGFNWLPPQALYNVLSKVCDINEIINTVMNDLSENVEYRELVSRIKTSHYDYRPFLRAGK